MEPKRRREFVLGALALLLAIGAYEAYETWSRPSVASPAASNVESRDARRTTRPTPARPPARPPSEQGRAAAAAHTDALQVHLDALDEARAEPTPDGRDIFRFRVKPPPPPPPSAARRGIGPEIPAPTGPPPLPPITLKFIGIVDLPPPGKRVAVLSDGRGSPVYGHEGDTVLGQYRILRIGAESIEMAYLDGRGRQTIRLSGS